MGIHRLDEAGRNLIGRWPADPASLEIDLPPGGAVVLELTGR